MVQLSLTRAGGKASKNMKTKWHENRMWVDKGDKWHRRHGPAIEWVSGRKCWYEHGRLLLNENGVNYQGRGMRWPKAGPCAERPMIGEDRR